MGMVALEKVETPEDMEALRGFIEEHKKHTGSTVAQALLDDFGTTVTQFVKVIMVDVNVKVIMVDVNVKVLKQARWFLVEILKI